MNVELYHIVIAVVVLESPCPVCVLGDGLEWGFVVSMSLTLLPIKFCGKHSLISPTTEDNISFSGEMFTTCNISYRKTKTHFRKVLDNVDNMAI